MKHNTLVIILTALLCICSIGITGYGASTECSKIIITSDPEYPPISWQDRSNPQRIIGVAIELVEMAFKDLGIPVESRYIGPWKRVLIDTASGTVDMIAGLYINEERKTTYDFVFPMCMTDPTVVFVMKGKTFPFKKWDDLKTLAGGGRLGDSYGEQFDVFAKKNLNIDMSASFKILYEKIKGGRNRYMIYGLYPGLAEAETLKVRDKIEYLPQPISSEGIYMAFSKKSQCTRHNAYLGKKLQEYVAAKIPQKLVDKYLKIWKDQANITLKP